MEIRTDEAKWQPAKTRAAVLFVQEHIASHPEDASNIYYFMTPDSIFNSFHEVEEEFKGAGFVIPQHAREVTHEMAKLFVALRYGVEPNRIIEMEVGRSATGFGWAVGVPEKVLKEQGVDLVDWDYETFASKEALSKMHASRAKSVRQ